MDYVVKCLKKEDYAVDDESNFIEVSHGGKKAYAVNEIRINNVAEEVKFSIHEVIGGRRCKVYPYIIGGDGLLITGMIGSTAYNRSAGGPIITSPDVMCATFINSDSPYNNPIVFSTESEIEVSVEKYTCVLRADSDYVAKLGPADTFKVRKSDRKIRFVKLNSRRENLADKLERLYSSKMLKSDR
jgi:NAD kinase